MPTKIFVTLPVRDLAQSVAFFTKLGYSFNPDMTDAKSACLIIGENVNIMLAVPEHFRQLTKKEIADANRTTEAIIALTTQHREQVVDIVSKALAAGGTEYREPEMREWMYGRSFADPDGHQWEVVWIDETKQVEARRKSLVEQK
jgi:predicted lactoylglutathione lyase